MGRNEILEIKNDNNEKAENMKHVVYLSYYSIKYGLMHK